MSLLTFIRSSTLWANVGMACTGLLRVRAWWMPFSPCQYDSRITAFMVVVLSRDGSWNMTLWVTLGVCEMLSVSTLRLGAKLGERPYTTSSSVTCTSMSAKNVSRANRGRYSEGLPLSMPSAPSRIAASKLASVFSGKAAEA